MKTLTATLALLFAASGAHAHEIWIERDGSGPARVYLGEPAEAPPPGGDPEFARLKAPTLIPAPRGAPIRRAGFIEVAVPPGDVRATDASVFAPWGPAGKRENVVYYARAGRAEPGATLPLEIAPAAANGDRFVLTRDGKPLAGTEILVIAPDRTTTKAVTDAQGVVALTPRVPGRYILSAATKDEGAATRSGGRLAVLHHITTTSFTVP